MKSNYVIKPCGDCAISVIFENEISEEINDHVANLKKAIEKADLNGFESCIPTYRSLLIRYNPQFSAYAEWKKNIDELINQSSISAEEKSLVYVIPVYYGDEFGPDLHTVASHNSLTNSQVIELHTANVYRIYMLGFTPGFPYLGGLDERIATPRLSQPRTKIEAGSVGIAGKQTGIYPIDSPGGWQIIGKTPIKLFDIGASPPILLEAGNYIEFTPIDRLEYDRIKKLVSDNAYRCKMYEFNRGGA